MSCGGDFDRPIFGRAVARRLGIPQIQLSIDVRLGRLAGGSVSSSTGAWNWHSPADIVRVREYYRTRPSGKMRVRRAARLYRKTDLIRAVGFALVLTFFNWNGVGFPLPLAWLRAYVAGRGTLSESSIRWWRFSPGRDGNSGNLVV